MGSLIATQLYFWMAGGHALRAGGHRCNVGSSLHFHSRVTDNRGNCRVLQPMFTLPNHSAKNHCQGEGGESGWDRDAIRERGGPRLGDRRRPYWFLGAGASNFKHIYITNDAPIQMMEEGNPT